MVQIQSVNPHALINRYIKTMSYVELETLLAFVLRCERKDIFVKDISINSQIEQAYESAVKRRLSGEPLQYIIGREKFMDFDFFVNSNTLIPRPETELLVKSAMDYISDMRKKKSQADMLNVLDLCTGCGNIAVSLARLVPFLNITATDLSSAALEIAYKNCVLNNVKKIITFHSGDMLKALDVDKKYTFDIMVCNPPYVKRDFFGSLQKEVSFEPRMALYGGEDGLDFYRIIADSAFCFLRPDGKLFLEIGLGQTQGVSEIFTKNNIYNIVDVKKDFSGIDRVLWISLS